MEINNGCSWGKIRAKIYRSDSHSEAVLLCLRCRSVFYTAWSNTDALRSSRCSSKADELWLALSLALIQQQYPISHWPLWEKVFSIQSPVFCSFSGVHWLNAFSLQRQHQILFSVHLRNPRSRRKSFVFSGKMNRLVKWFPPVVMVRFYFTLLKLWVKYEAAAVLPWWPPGAGLHWQIILGSTHTHSHTVWVLTEKGWNNQLTGPVTLTLNILMCMCV